MLVGLEDLHVAAAQVRLVALQRCVQLIAVTEHHVRLAAGAAALARQQHVHRIARLRELKQPVSDLGFTMGEHHARLAAGPAALANQQHVCRFARLQECINIVDGRGM